MVTLKLPDDHVTINTMTIRNDAKDPPENVQNVVGAGDTVWLIQHPIDENWQSRLDKQVSRLRIDIDYKSMYGEKKTASSG